MQLNTTDDSHAKATLLSERGALNRKVCLVYASKNSFVHQVTCVLKWKRILSYSILYGATCSIGSVFNSWVILATSFSGNFFLWAMQNNYHTFHTK